MDVGLVVPAYDYDPEITYPYLVRLHRELSPDRILLEVDVDQEERGEHQDESPPSVEVHTVDGRRGKGSAIDRGFDRLEQDVYVFVDDDASVPPESVGRLIEAVEAGADMAVGSRRHPDSEHVEYRSTLRRLMGDVFAWTARKALMPRLYDYQCGAKAVTADMWRMVEGAVEEEGFAWDVDAVTAVHEAGGEVAEVPVRWRDSSLSRVDVFSAALELSMAVLKLSRWRRGAEREPPETCREVAAPSLPGSSVEPHPNATAAPYPSPSRTGDVED